MIRILITGGAGFIGSSLAERLLDNPKYFIVLIDNLSTGNVSNLPKNDNCIFIKCDVNKHNDIASVMTAYSFDFVFHYAALVGVKRTLENPIMVLDDIDGVKNILELSKNTGVKRIFFSSSSEVYGEPVELPQNELTTPLNSRLPYAIVKNVGEAYCKSFKQEYNLDYTIFRFFNTYGKKQSDDFVMTKFFNQALKGEDITIFGLGDQTRTFCYIEDNIEATINAFENNHFVNDILNIGNEKATTILELANLIIEKTNSESKIVFLPPLKEGDMTRRMPDNTKMKSLLNRKLLPLNKGIDILLSTIK